MMEILNLLYMLRCAVINLIFKGMRQLNFVLYRIINKERDRTLIRYTNFLGYQPGG